MFPTSHELVFLFLDRYATLRQRFEPPSTCYTSTSHTSSAFRGWHLDPAPWRFAGNSRESPGDAAPARSTIKIGLSGRIEEVDSVDAYTFVLCDLEGARRTRNHTEQGAGGSSLMQCALWRSRFLAKSSEQDSVFGNDRRKFRYA